MASEKHVAYTAEQTKELVDRYAEGKGESTEALAIAMGKTVRSIVAKLSNEGVYQAKSHAAKGTRVTKEMLVDEIASKMGVPADKLESLEKATHGALEMVAKALHN